MKVGIDLGGSHIAIGIVDEEGKIINKKEKSFSQDERTNIKIVIENFIIENILELSDKYNIESIGIAIPGTLSEKEIINSCNLGIEKYDIVEALREKISIPIKIKNDARCAAIAENKYGCIKNYDNGIFLTLGTGIGCSVVYKNEIMEGKMFPGFEASHMIIQKDGLICNCGKKGCFETLASMKKFKNDLRAVLGLDYNTHGYQLYEIIINNENDERIIKTIDEYTQNLAIGISNLINIFEPEVIGIGGSFSHFQSVLFPKLKEKILNSELLFNKRNSINIVIAELGNDAGIIGASLI